MSTALRTRFSQRTYEEMLNEARSVSSDIAERFLVLGTLILDMLQERTLAEIAADIECDTARVRDLARVAGFWGEVRIGPSPTGRRPVYAMYNRVVYDPLMSEADRQEIRRHARRGRHVVEEMITGARVRTARQVAVDYSQGQPLAPNVVTSARAALRPAPGEHPDAYAVLLSLRAVVDRVGALESADDVQITQLEEMAQEIRECAIQLRERMR